ncbi:hypothetical protein VN97_g10706 [Penicillium thymicola]|uniref:Non-histone chromosomal protein 6 n=1 Tax=Penicillium thymicola TaxID=293382 RepID=A0AAI9T942_PENTH|nr:hypothetical protein VN97_g10706 [Penicillium thymicola]
MTERNPQEASQRNQRNCACLSLAVAPLSLLLLRPSPLYSSLLLLSSYTTTTPPYKTPLTKKKGLFFQHILIRDHRIHVIIMPKESTTKSTRKAPEKRVQRRKKDPNAPKRGLSAYMFFANDNRDKVREENPGISFGQVGKQLGDKWKALSETDRKPYDAKAAADKKRYEEEKAAYLAKAEEEEEEESS